MKRIRDGLTYNTDTSTRLGRSRWDGPGEWKRFVETLYVTRGGAFFVVQKHTITEWDERERENASRNEWKFRPVTDAEAEEWMSTGEVRVFHNPFGDPPEAAAEAKPGATIYVRLPATLKRAVEAAANERNLSGNVWVMQCIERCLENRSLQDVKELAYVLKIAEIFRAHHDNGEWTRAQFLEAMANIADNAHTAGMKFLGSKALDNIDEALSGDPEYQEMSKKFNPKLNLSGTKEVPDATLSS